MPRNDLVHSLLDASRVTLVVILLVVPPIAATIAGVWFATEYITTTSKMPREDKCGMAVIPELVMKGIAGLIGFAIGIAASFTVASAITAWSIRNLEDEPEASH